MSHGVSGMCDISSLGGLASTGAVVATGVAVGGMGDAPLVYIVFGQSARISGARARQILDLSDRTLSYDVVAIEAELVAELNRLEPLSDGSSPRVRDLRRKRDVVRRALSFMASKSMQPRQLDQSANAEPAA